MKKIKKPLLFLIFNRFDQTKLVFEKIRKYKPSMFFIAADGPRDNCQEAEICKEIRSYVIENIDWECEVYTLFRDKNLGCGIAVSSAISWFFEHVEDGLIIEDDCLPSESFFIFCEQMLDLYKNHHEVMHISGVNYLGQLFKINTYDFTLYSCIWGWATWRRAWKYYEYNIGNYSPNKLNHVILRNSNNDYNQFNFWNNYLIKLSEREIDTWDLQWQISVWMNFGICIMPAVNLVENIGFAEDALHTKNIDSPLAKLKVYQYNFDRIKKRKIKINYFLSDYIFYYAYLEKFELNKNQLNSLKITIEQSLIHKLKSKELTFRDKIYIIRKKFFN